MKNNIFIEFNIEDFLKLLGVDKSNYKYNISQNYTINEPNSTNAINYYQNTTCCDKTTTYNGGIPNELHD